MISISIEANDDLSLYVGVLKDYSGDVLVEARHKRPEVLLEQLSRVLIPTLKPLD